MAKKTGKKTANSSWNAQLAQATATAKTLAAQVKALGLPTLTPEERATSNGKLRAGEADAMETIFDAIDAQPAVLVSLADKDGGVDPTVVETAPARDDLAKALALDPLAQMLDAIHAAVSDGILSAASQAKDVSVAAYQIGRANAPTNPQLRAALATATAFYGAPARKQALARKKAANKAKRAAKSPGTPKG